MGILEDAEIGIELGEGDDYLTYRNLVDHYQVRASRSFDQVRYAMAISYKLADAGRESSPMFVGSIGVLGNVVATEGMKAIEKFREIHDVDLIIKSPTDYPLVGAAFDRISNFDRSLSIDKKRTIRGSSVSADGSMLEQTTADVYVPSQGIGLLTNLSGTAIHDGHWDERVKSDFFGIPIYCAPPMTLLEMKLAVNCQSGIPRQKDCQDIFNLLGVLERKGTNPDRLTKWIGSKKAACLRSILKIKESFGHIPITQPNFTRGYGECLLR